MLRAMSGRPLAERRLRVAPLPEGREAPHVLAITPESVTLLTPYPRDPGRRLDPAEAEAVRRLAGLLAAGALSCGLWWVDGNTGTAPPAAGLSPGWLRHRMARYESVRLA